MRPVLVLVVLLALPVASARAAATVAATPIEFDDYKETAVDLRIAATGDAGRDTLAATLVRDPVSGEPTGAVVTDSDGATARDGCEQVDAMTVRCTANPLPYTPALVELRLSGGAGDDVVDGSRLPDGVLLGGPGADRLIGRRPSARSPHVGPVLQGGAGADTMLGLGAVSYRYRTRPVRVDLRSHAAVQGEADEHDTIDGPQVVYGGRGGDTLMSGPSRDELFGEGGRDRVSRLGRGDFALVRGGGADHVSCVAPGAWVSVDRRDVVTGCPRQSIHGRPARPRGE